MMGQGIMMEGHTPVADSLDASRIRPEIDEMEKSIAYLVNRLPRHGDYLGRYCPAKMM